MCSQAAAALEVSVAAFAHTDLLCEFALVADATRARKLVRGARSAGGERTWLRLRERVEGLPDTLPHDARLRVSYGALTAEFALDTGAFAHTHAHALALRAWPRLWWAVR